MGNRRNGTIELLRAVFCFAILLFHISMDNFGMDWRPESWGGVLRYGALGVEFFFITSGYFMAKSIQTQDVKHDAIGVVTWKFMWRKVKTLLPYHIAFNLIAIWIGLFRGHSIVVNINRFSCLLFLPTLGFNDGEWLLGAEWYVGYMLFAMLIIFVFYCIIGKELMMKIIAPIGAVVIYGYIAANAEILISGNHMLRAFGGLLLGFTVYGLSVKVKSIFSRIKNEIIIELIRIYPVIVILLFVVYLNTNIGTDAQPFIVLILASGLIFTFAEEGMISHSHALNNKVIYWLGKMCLPVYLVQNITRSAAQMIFSGRSVYVVFAAELILSILAGIVSYYCWDILKNRFNVLLRKPA